MTKIIENPTGVSGAGDRPKQGALTNEERLAGAKLLGERLNVVLKGLTILVGVAVAVIVIGMALQASRSRAVVVEAFQVPKALADKGMSGEVLAAEVQDAITVIQGRVRAEAANREINNAWTREVAIEVPQTGVSFGEVDRLLRSWLGEEVYVGGALVTQTDGSVVLTIRATNLSSQRFAGTSDQIPILARSAAEHIYGQADPVLYAAYLVGEGRYDEVGPFVEGALPKTPRDKRALLFSLWGNALANLGDVEGSREKYEQAVTLDPQAWGLRNNLSLSLLEVGEEAAFSSAEKMVRDLERAPRAQREKARRSSYLALANDWTGLAEEYGRDVGRDLILDPLPALAEVEGRRHDWATAAEHLASAFPGPDKAATTLLVAGFQSIEAGDATVALSRMEAFSRTWNTDDGVRYSYPDGTCFLGLAYGMAGRYHDAEHVFAGQAYRWVSCYAFRADVLEMQGDRVAAGRAYGEAIRLAPSLPFAYHRRGLALLKQGRIDLAEARFRQAHERGPRWADPLKGWGDTLAKRNRWADALEKYDQAIRFAPNWRDLRLARAAALDALGRRDEATRERRSIGA